MNVNELRKRLMEVQAEANELCSKINQHIPARCSVGDSTLIARTGSVEVKTKNENFEWTHDQARSARDWLIAAYPLDPAPDAGWVSVEERLPEEERDVLVWSRAADGFVQAAMYKSGRWRSTWNHDTLGNHVTHWRELPAPPASERSKP
jgi:hypothetical protein